MAIDQAMQVTNGLLTQAQALAAFVAHLELVASESDADLALRTQLDRVVRALGAQDIPNQLSSEERKIVASFARSYLRQALDLMEHPERPGAWSYEDPVVLQAQGAASAAVAKLFVQAGVGAPGVRILDVGTGVARLAIAFCETFPGSTVVGIDPWEPALRLARENVTSAGLDSRIVLLPTPLEDFEDDDGFDLVWLPTFFIPDFVLDDGLLRLFRCTRPEATVVLGMTGNSSDDIAAATDALMTVRSGGTILLPEQAISRLTKAGFVDAEQVIGGLPSPLALITGRHP